MAVAPIDLDFVMEQYVRFLPGLRRVREVQRRRHAERGDPKLERFGPYRALSLALRGVGLPSHFRRRFKPQFDDLEAEITYLLVRAARPATVVEIAPDRGWSTTWLLEALRDNETGHLHSYDVFDYSTRTIPVELASGRWTFTLGDVTRPPDRLPAAIDFLFLDAAHSAPFARWYLNELLPRLLRGTPVAIHDIFPPPDRMDRFGEAGVVQNWLVERGEPYFTASPAVASEAFNRINALKRELGIGEPIHPSSSNPMVFFRR